MVTTTVASVDNTNEEANVHQVAGFLKEHEELEMVIPVLFGLFVTSRLQLRGANALLVNLAVASLFRQMFKQLKNTPFMTAVTAPETPQNATSSLLGDGVAIVHSVPGRIRLRIDQLTTDANFAKRLERLLINDECVISVRINRAAASLVINYESGNLSDLDLGLKLMSALNSARQETVQV
jgi:Heavy metal associated domain 2